MSLNLTGLRVKVTLRGKTVYGLARVCFDEGHRYAGNYEVQRVNGAAILVPFGSVEPGPNADQIPPGVEFPDLDIPYQPVFAEPGVMQSGAKVTGKNVIFPGDYSLLRDLINEVDPGWLVRWTSHEANGYAGNRTVAEVTNSGVRLDPKEGAPEYYTWPAEGEDFVVEHPRRGGTAITEFKAAHAYVGGNRASTLTVWFQPPQQH